MAETLFLILVGLLLVDCGFFIVISLRGVVDHQRWKSNRWRHMAWMCLLMLLVIGSSLIILMFKQGI